VGAALAPGAIAEVVLARPPLAVELVVRATARSGARPRLALRYALGETVMEARPIGAAQNDATRETIEYRIQAPPAEGVAGWPGYEFRLADAADDPALEIGDIELTRP